ncbi:hypothetical protein JB92DRAFT_2838972 [Gautieria morchelliformis]|nr:hypothetical protein JB92DRAFT_2838972 [Gautieria morchelliformis]
MDTLSPDPGQLASLDCYPYWGPAPGSKVADADALMKGTQNASPHGVSLLLWLSSASALLFLRGSVMRTLEWWNSRAHCKDFSRFCFNTATERIAGFGDGTTHPRYFSRFCYGTATKRDFCPGSFCRGTATVHCMVQGWHARDTSRASVLAQRPSALSVSVVVLRSRTAWFKDVHMPELLLALLLWYWDRMHYGDIVPCAPSGSMIATTVSSELLGSRAAMKGYAALVCGSFPRTTCPCTPPEYQAGLCGIKKMQETSAVQLIPTYDDCLSAYDESGDRKMMSKFGRGLMTYTSDPVVDRRTFMQVTVGMDAARIRELTIAVARMEN